jgi:hypothetical protein
MASRSGSKEPAPPPLPTDAELDVLAVLWRQGASTVREVHEALGKDSGYTTTLKQLQLMFEKGLVVRNERYRSQGIFSHQEIKQRRLWTKDGYIPAIPQNECVCGCWQTAVFFFVRVEFTGRVKALLRSELLPRLGQRRAFTPAVILFIALPKPEDKSDPG